jgi:hypothetical protein
LQFPNEEFNTPEAATFLANMKAIEESIKNEAMVRSQEWFGKQINSREVIDEKFSDMLRYPKMKGTQVIDYSKAPTLTAKLPCWKSKVPGGVDTWQTEVFDADGNPLFLKTQSAISSPVDFIGERSQVICLIQCGGLWFVNGKVSITWNLKQVVVQKPRESAVQAGICFIKPSAKDREVLKESSEPQGPGPIDTIQLTLAEDSDDEEAAPVVPPTPTPVPTPPVPTPTPAVPTPTPVEETAAPVTVVPKKVVIKKKL